MKWYLKVIKDNYANFGGRARRQEYWMFALIQIIIFTFLVFLSSFLDDILSFNISITLFSIYFLATLVPWLAVNVRRLHDIGKSGTYFFVNLIPLIGRIWFLILVCSNGNIGSNKYGPDPKAAINDEIDEIGKVQLD
jgi:uncharacterized membrane protein YhaH (DUF805 family)